MHTRSQTRNLHNQQQQAPPAVVEPFNLEDPLENPPPPPPSPMDGQRTMAQLLEAPTEGYEDAIVVPEINANFELKHDHFYDEVPERPEYVEKSISAPTPVKAVEESCVTCGGAHSYQTCPATSGNVYRDNIQEYVSQAAAANFNQGNTGYRAQISNQIRPPGFPPVVQPPVYQAPAYQAPAPQSHGVSKEDFHSYVKANDAVMRNMQTQGQNMQNQLNNLATSNQRLESMLGNFIKMNTASTSGTLPSNTVTNPKEDLKGITTRSGVAYKGPTIPITSSSPKVMERDTEVTKDTMPPTNNGSTEDVPSGCPYFHHDQSLSPQISS
ncbi:hypothetical protein Tco_1315437 [Tanacetum coccineum]